MRLEAYTVDWQKEFHRVKQDILNSTPIQENRIEHIGSTVIKDMVAKPILCAEIIKLFKNPSSTNGAG
ncbi:GrpB family protein [Bacillus sp. WLY-B-L8]|uniref:GrpB family protein n=1 Tax=Bacillus multifaciens TaxID=3068506 RepID=UPI002741EF8D|nr:GrpB family protein [Bacillus sp. WLY-B-L8]MDP7978577.1 GrpB family protein [Bacillus sp. WLY-B-L8]